MFPHRWLLVFVIAVTGLMSGIGRADAQTAGDPHAGYGGAQATYDAYRIGEAERQQNIGIMVDRIDQIRWYRGLPPTGAGRYVERYPPSLDYVYATGQTGILGSRRGYVRYRSEDIFEPWPFVPGDIWGYPDDRGVRQPIAQRHTQTGPNRWESHPVYRDSDTRPPLRTAPSGPREF